MWLQVPFSQGAYEEEGGEEEEEEFVEDKEANSQSSLGMSPGWDAAYALQMERSGVP
jgi:hypothetical protein